MGLTDAQYDCLAAIDDVSEHVGFEHEPDEYAGISTCGFAHIDGIGGRSSFVRRVKSLAEANHPQIEKNRRDEYRISIGCLDLALRESHDGGYRLSMTNVADHAIGPSHQRLDLREDLHKMILRRFRENGYLADARVKSRMD